jgi:hypothetical protein
MPQQYNGGRPKLEPTKEQRNLECAPEAGQLGPRELTWWLGFRRLADDDVLSCATTCQGADVVALFFGRLQFRPTTVVLLRHRLLASVSGSISLWVNKHRRHMRPSALQLITEEVRRLMVGKQSHSTQTKRKAITIMRRSCSDSLLTASQVAGVFGSGPV